MFEVNGSESFGKPEQIPNQERVGNTKAPRGKMPKRLSVTVSASPRPIEKKMCTSPISIAPEPGKISEVTPFLYISDDRVSSEELTRLGITALIDCRTDAEQELRGLVGDGSETVRLHLPLKDNKSEDVSKFFHLAISFIEKQRLASGRVLVHCTKGISRSSAIVCAFLIWSEKSCCREALTKLRTCHPAADPNPSFSMQLVEFAHSRFKSILAYQVLDDGKALVGPLSRENVDELLQNQTSLLLLVARTRNCQYLWSSANDKEIPLQFAKRAAETLAGIQMAPQEIQRVQSNESTSVLDSFMEDLTCL